MFVATHQTNAPSVNQFLENNCIPVLEHPPLSPDLAPVEFYLFPKVNTALKGTHYQSVEGVKSENGRVVKKGRELQSYYE